MQYTSCHVSAISFILDNAKFFLLENKIKFEVFV